MGRLPTVTETHSGTVLYVSHDLFSPGGIQRYGRYEVQALSELLGRSNVSACSLAGPIAGGFTEALPITVVGRGFSRASKASFMMAVLHKATQIGRRGVVICDHVALAPIGLLCKLALGRRYVVNVYGAEVWGHLSRLERAALTHADVVISDCEFTKGHLESRHEALRRRITVVPDCVDCDRFAPGDRDKDIARRVGVNENSRVLLTVSRLPVSGYKGHERVMNAMAAAQRSGTRCTYLIVGDGPDRERLQAVAARLALDGAVVFAGNVADDELPAIYRLCDIFVLVSGSQEGERWEGEGVPLVVLEAQASGKPVITGSRDGAAESIADGKTGFLVDPHEPAQLGDALERLLRDERLRVAMAGDARRHALEQFSYEVFRTRLSEALGPLLTPVSAPAAPS